MHLVVPVCQHVTDAFMLINKMHMPRWTMRVAMDHLDVAMLTKYGVHGDGRHVHDIFRLGCFLSITPRAKRMCECNSLGVRF